MKLGNRIVGREAGRTALVALLTMSLTFGGVPASAWAYGIDGTDAASEAQDMELQDVLDQGEEASDADGDAMSEEATSTEDGLADADSPEEDAVSEEEAGAALPDESAALDDASIVEQEVEPTETRTEDAEPIADVSPDPLEASGYVDKGTWGTCSWSLDNDGLLKIWPTNGTTGKLANSRGHVSEDYPEDNFFPWHEYSDRIHTFTMDSGVQLPSDISGMFQGCSSLTSIDVSNWDTSSVTDMSNVFSNCISLFELDVSNWDTSKVKTMEAMFGGCNSLASLDMSNWDTSSVTNMSAMFLACGNLGFVDIANWNTSRVTDMRFMFGYCDSLKYANLANWDTSRVTDMWRMFFACVNLTALDLSGWNTSALTDYDMMFYGCDSLQQITVGSQYRIDKVFPDPTSSNGCWYSAAKGRWFDADRLSSRTGIADTYYSRSSFNGSLDDAVVAKIADQYYTGQAIYPDVAITLGGSKLSSTAYALSYYNNKELGTASILITGRNGYNGSKTVTFKIVKPKISDAQVEKTANQTYTGKAIKPAVVVSLGMQELTAGTDYTLSYKNNTNVGTATVTITGKGNYTGTKSVTFAIVAADLSRATISSIADQTYTGRAIKPAVTVKLGSATLTSGADYTVAYKDNTNVGTATVTVTGKGNYTGTKSASFRIVGGDPMSATQEMHRLYNPNSGEHFYTASAQEKDALVSKHGWKYEGIGWVAPVTSKTPVYRLYNANAGDHHYTTSAQEKDALVGRGWKYEGVGWYSDDAKGTPLYRQYNPNAVAGSHNYTTSTRERDALVTKYGWHDEGIGWYGVKQ